MFNLKKIRLFEDDYILLLDKPINITVNKSESEKDITIQDVLEEHYLFSKQYSLNSENEEFLSKSGIVHRLDKQTSGVLLIAKTPDSYVKLKSQFLERSVEKEYAVFVLGDVQDSEFEVSVPIVRDPRNRLRMALSSSGRPATTDFEKVSSVYSNDTILTFLKAFPKTGRTHQIRVHLAGFGVPVLGDPIYCTKKQYETSRLFVERLMLHAEKLTFDHPEDQKRITFSSHLPKEFETLLKI